MIRWNTILKIKNICPLFVNDFSGYLKENIYIHLSSTANS